MNYETSGPIAAAPMPLRDDDERPRSRKGAIIGAVAIIGLALGGAWYAFSGNGGGEEAGKAAPATATTAAPAAAATGAAGGSEAAPRVTVMAPGRTTVETIITATGTIGARREMPVGVAGEGGQVLRVLVEPGQWVGAGQVLAVIDRSTQVQQLAQLQAQIRVAEADAQLARNEFDRAEALSGRGFISRADLDRRAAARDSAAARVRVVQAQVAEAQARTRRLDIRAPAAGLILTRDVEPGQVVSAGSGVLFRMARGGEMELLAAVGEGDLRQISSGARVDVTPVGSERSYRGQIWQIAPVINPQTRQGTARIALSYAPGLRPGGFAEARIIAGAVQAPLLPESAVLNDAEGSYVYVVGGDNKVVRRAVTVGRIDDRGVPIVGGLDGTERIVVSAGGFLNPGDLVAPVMQRPAGAAATPAAPAAPAARGATPAAPAAARN